MTHEPISSPHHLDTWNGVSGSEDLEREQLARREVLKKKIAALSDDAQIKKTIQENIATLTQIWNALSYQQRSERMADLEQILRDQPPETSTQ